MGVAVAGLNTRRNWLLDSQLVLYLPFWDSRMKGSPIISQDIYSHSCPVTGALWRPDGRYFDGTDDYITVPDAASLRITGDLTIEGWVKLNDNAGYETFAARYYIHEFEARFTNGVMVFVDGDGANYNLYTGTSAIGTNWAHVAWVRGATFNTYINGSLDKSQALGAYTVTTGTNDVIIGARKIAADPATHFLNGIIGEVWVHARALSLSEVQSRRLETMWRYH